MKQYTLEEAAQALGVSTTTLRLWVREIKDLHAAVEQQRVEYDMRQRYLTLEQVQALAVAHGRELRQDDENTGQRLAALEKRIERLEAFLHLPNEEEMDQPL